MATTRRKTTPGKNSNGYILPDDKLRQREAVFVLYQDMGVTRSIGRLEQLLADQHPEIAAKRTALERWSRIHDWAKRVKAHDSAMAQGRVQVLTAPPAPAAKPNPEFNQIDALLGAANQALTRAMSASPIVTRPSDVTALVSAAEKALKLIETIKANQTGKVSRQEVADEIKRILGMVEKARRADVDAMVEAELKRRGIAIDATGEVVAAAPVQVDAVPIEADEPDLPVVEEVIAEAPAALVEEKMRLFADVLKAFQGGG